MDTPYALTHIYTTGLAGFTARSSSALVAALAYPRESGVLAAHGVRILAALGVERLEESFALAGALCHGLAQLLDLGDAVREVGGVAAVSALAREEC